MKEKRTHVIGLMSGTSLDGVDLVYASFVNKGDVYSYAIIKSETYKYPLVWESKLKDAFSQTTSEIEKLDIEYGEYLGALVNTFISEHSIDEIDFIASHGHTIFHNPEKGVTLQIGDGETISKITNHKVVYDFRTQDVKFGGQGAPLVPIGDRLLFSEYEFCLNLGGFANISFEKDGDRKAFDICPVNIVMNHYAQLLGFDYDDKGLFASQGKVHAQLLDELNNLPFYNDTEPKSLGYEFVVEVIFPLIEKYDLSEKDRLRTFIDHVASQITSKINSKGQLFITGGGVYNEFLIQQLKKKISNEIVIPNNELIDFKEALIFAFLGLLKINNEVNCLKSVTGASVDHSSGKIRKVK